MDIQQLFQESARTILRPLRLLQIMATDYYIVGNLRKDYEESYSKLGHRWKDYVQLKYDIIDQVQKDGLLLVGINPSFD